MFSPIEASKSIKDEFISYISTTFHIADEDYASRLKEALDVENAIAKGPYLEIGDSFKTGKSLDNLIIEGEVSPLFRELERNLEDGEKEIKLLRKLYLHQESAIQKINDNKNLVVTTGTGSGKTECFLIPILNHLLREKQSGTLDNGVRAILIYPMNALANDQMKRLRSILGQYLDISFGVYNSSTKEEDVDGIAEYGKVYKDENGTPLKPLKNEVISRKAMQKTPPHILVTNYAMLEYMMLRPHDDKVFSGAKLRFLVLDEAHIYRGATGIETSLLLRRLKARIGEPSRVLHILTSATLGGKESNKDIVSFANTLCEAGFREEDIIRSETEMPVFPDEEIDYPLELFEELANPDNSLNDILDKYSVEYEKNKPDGEILYNLCLRTKAYRVLRNCAIRPMTVKKITSLMKCYVDISERNVINLINVVVKAEKDKTALIKARYHMFVRALEGVYITLGAEKNLLLTRKKYYENENDFRRVFEAAVCDDCGRLGIAGRIENDRLEFAGDRFADNIDIFLIKEQNETLFEGDEECEEDETEEIGKNDFLICSRCGEIHHESLKYDFKCSDGYNNLIKIRKSERRGIRNEAKCPCCNQGHMKLFYIGYDAATAVLGTELFEQLPEYEKRLRSSNQEVRLAGNLFATARPKTIDITRKKRQFLVFSDSRSEAAYYACYMTSFYEEFLRRRGIWHVIEENKQNIKKNPWNIKTLVDELTSYFDTKRTFASPTDNGTENITQISRTQAWVAVLNEMINARRGTSLVSLGVINFIYKGNTDELMQIVAGAYGLTQANAKALFDILALDIVYNGALEGDCNLTSDMKEYIYYSPKARRFTKCKESNKDRAKNYLNGWIPRARINGRLFNNGRITRVMNSLGISEEDAKKLLNDYWDGVLNNSEYGLTHTGDNEYYFSTDKFLVQVGEDNLPLYVCDKCGKTTMTNFKNKCISLKCDGQLREVSREKHIRDNHYAKLYKSKHMEPLHIKEHTAQLGREEQQKYQELFINKNINALSCSTTFEMGVDVGDLETVYLRNMPPSPSNYVQRAGRAGRSLHTAAYSLTYSKLSSHDFNYFEDPEKMISGKIGVPLFAVKNEKVVLRHIFAVALSKFFSIHEDVYNGNNADVLLNRDGYERLCEYLNAKPTDLKKILIKSIPKELHSDLGIDDDSWIDMLIGVNGQLSLAVGDFRNTVKWYMSEIEQFKSQDDNQAVATYERRLWEYRKAADDKRGKNDLIEFLVRNNILPKYGFPVDTVELHQSMDEQAKKLQMVRDLQLAIAEYAPDAEVVADGKLYTSRYIRKLPQATGQDWEEVFIAECKNPACRTWNHKITEPSMCGENCVSCQEIIEKARWRKAIEPRKGFIAETPKDVPLRKPDRSYRSDDYYIGDPQRKLMEKKTFIINDYIKVQMETTSNDSLMVVCKDDFHVCPSCGYAIGSMSMLDENIINSFANTIVKNHYSPWGKYCDSKLYKRSLCHAFKTDVVKIVFGTSRAKNASTMLSVMYALLEAVSSVLDIERTDIKGCLHRVRFEGSLVFSIILYDAVAGGAGHVRRIVTDDCAVFQKVVKKAIDITKNCSCNPSCYNCLRNYYNQTIHDQLNRMEAYGFLEQFNGLVMKVCENEFEQESARPIGEYDENMISIKNGYSLSAYKNWSELQWLIPGEIQSLFKKFDRYQISLPTEYGAKIVVAGTNVASEAMFVWNEKRILLFDDDKEMICIAGWKSVHCKDVVPREFSELV